VLLSNINVKKTFSLNLCNAGRVAVTNSVKLKAISIIFAVLLHLLIFTLDV